ncbi:MAG TPA: zinc ribbon domain-containing protein [Candidatus Anoxymicrobiaceae bacterium]|jgi:hypothetical protein
MLYSTYLAVVVIFGASSVLAQQLAKRYGRDEHFYFFVGMFLGPISVVMALTPLPTGTTRTTEIANKPIRFVKSKACPECGREVCVKAQVCPYCLTGLEPALWENPMSIEQP